MKKLAMYGALVFLCLYLVPVLVISGQEREKSVIKTSHLGPYAVAITCLNGADPTGSKIGRTVIMSCGNPGNPKDKENNQ